MMDEHPDTKLSFVTFPSRNSAETNQLQPTAHYHHCLVPQHSGLPLSQRKGSTQHGALVHMLFSLAEL